jgi:hypothetical protein
LTYFARISPRPCRCSARPAPRRRGRGRRKGRSGVPRRVDAPSRAGCCTCRSRRSPGSAGAHLDVGEHLLRGCRPASPRRGRPPRAPGPSPPMSPRRGDGVRRGGNASRWCLAGHEVHLAAGGVGCSWVSGNLTRVAMTGAHATMPARTRPGSRT